MQRAYKLGVAAFAALAVLGFGAWLYAQEPQLALHPFARNRGQEAGQGRDGRGRPLL